MLLQACAIPQYRGLRCSGGGMPPPEHLNIYLQWREIVLMQLPWLLLYFFANLGGYGKVVVLLRCDQVDEGEY